MSRRDFQSLLAEFFRTAGVAGARAVPGAGLCEFNGFAVALYHDERTDPHHLDAYIDFGAVPLGRQREVFRELLLHHMDLVSPHRTVVGLDGASDSIVLVARIPLDAVLGGAHLAGILRQLIRQVFIWRSPAPAAHRPARRHRQSRRSRRPS
jgi:hypothetical protein